MGQPPTEPREFRVADVPPGSTVLLGDVAVFNFDGAFYATQARCTHRQGPLYEGALQGPVLTCPWHGARFDIRTGAVLRGPATVPLTTYTVTIEGGVGRVEVPRRDAVRSE